MVARKLDARLRDHIASSRGGNAFSSATGAGEGAFGRPCTYIAVWTVESVSFTSYACAVLVLLDRNVDLVPMISHSWTYQALVNDVLGMKLNRVAVEVRLGSVPGKIYCRLTIRGYTGTRRR